MLASLAAGTHGSLHPKKYWECGLRTERKELPSPSPPPLTPNTILCCRVQISSAIFPALLLGLSLEPLWFCPIPTKIPRKAGG